MRSMSLSWRRLAAIAGTRGMLGFGAGLLAGPRFRRKMRRTVGLTLVGVGIASTIPLAWMVYRARTAG
jgi:hypothetical protein